MSIKTKREFLHDYNESISKEKEYELSQRCHILELTHFDPDIISACMDGNDILDPKVATVIQDTM